MLFRKFQAYDDAEKIQKEPKYPRSQDSCGNQKNHRKEAYPASRKIRKSTVFTALPGSLTLEAAFVLPVLIMLMTALMSLTTMMMTELRLQHAMEQAGTKLAGYAYAAAALNAEEKGSLLGNVSEDVALTVASEQLVRKQVTEEAGADFLRFSGLENGWSGISFLGSGFNQDTQNIVIRASYYLKVPFFSVFGAKIHITQKIEHRAWTGKECDGSADEKLVYVTEYGTVYHSCLSCSHLKLSIEAVAKSRVDSRRNSSGSKYTPCELCGEAEATQVYITAYGDCYHTNRNCSGLKRTIRSLPLSQVGNLPLCKTCQRRYGQ